MNAAGKGLPALPARRNARATFAAGGRGYRNARAAELFDGVTAGARVPVIAWRGGWF